MGENKSLGHGFVGFCNNRNEYISRVITSENVITHPVWGTHRTWVSVSPRVLQASAQKHFSTSKYMRAARVGKNQSSSLLPVRPPCPRRWYRTCCSPDATTRTDSQPHLREGWTLLPASLRSAGGPPKRSTMASDNLFATQREKECDSFTQDPDHTSTVSGGPLLHGSFSSEIWKAGFK